MGTPEAGVEVLEVLAAPTALAVSADNGPLTTFPMQRGAAEGAMVAQLFVYQEVMPNLIPAVAVAVLVEVDAIEGD